MDSEDRIRKLESKVGLLVSIADSDAHPFICTCLDAEMDLTQVDKTLALVSRVENSLGTSTPITYAQFEKELQLIVPAKKDNPEFAKSIIRGLNRENKFILPSRRFKKEGVNI